MDVIVSKWKLFQLDLRWQHSGNWHQRQSLRDICRIREQSGCHLSFSKRSFHNYMYIDKSNLHILFVQSVHSTLSGVASLQIPMGMVGSYQVPSGLSEQMWEGWGGDQRRRKERSHEHPNPATPRAPPPPDVLHPIRRGIRRIVVAPRCAAAQKKRNKERG